MSIADCLNNSKVGDYLLVRHGLLDKYLIVEKKYQSSTGYYPVIINIFGERVDIFPNNYNVEKIIKKCQKQPV